LINKTKPNKTFKSMMKKMRLFSSIALLGAMALAISCDEETNIDGGGSIPVGDGFFISKVGSIPTVADQLKDEVVEKDGFASEPREGFFANYIFLTAGNYNIVSVLDQELNKTYGGPVVASPTTGSDCDLGSYTLVEEFVEDGAAIAVAADGLYKVIFDNTTKEIILYRIQKANIIGGAASFGWSNDVKGDMTPVGTVSATGATFKVTGVDMKSGEYKVRFNCRWQIDRRTDPSKPYSLANGYGAFTNFGGSSAANLATGGANLKVAFGNDGKYDFTLTWNSVDGFKLTPDNKVPVLPKAANTYAWGIIGDGTPTGWDADTDLALQAGATTSTATYEIASIALTAGKEFKFRANDNWDINIGPKSGTVGTVTGGSNFDGTGDNWKITNGGNYKVTITTTTTGEKWNITFVKL
jgi:hypothetical protein